jgi:hypothetical protein
LVWEGLPANNARDALEGAGGPVWL